MWSFRNCPHNLFSGSHFVFIPLLIFREFQAEKIILFALFATSMRFSISRWLCIHIFTPEVNYNNKHPSYCTNMLIMLHWCPSQVGCNLGPCIYTHLSLAPNLNYFKGMRSPKGSLLSCASQVILQYKPLQVLEWPADVPNSYILPGSRRRLQVCIQKPKTNFEMQSQVLK